MNTVPQGAPYTGVDAMTPDATNSKPLHIEAKLINESAVGMTGEVGGNILRELSADQHSALLAYLKSRLAAGIQVRNKRLSRMAKIDRSISTWQRLDPTESKREELEDATGKSMALPINLPVLASHLNDMVAYFSEALAPIANPFFQTSGDTEVTTLATKMNRDAVTRDYYGQMAMAIRSLCKYNIGGFHLEWQSAGASSMIQSEAGNYWQALDMYNTLWDPSVRNPQDIPDKGEWAATICLENRLALMRKSLTGAWHGLDELLSKQVNTSVSAKYYREAISETSIDSQGEDGRSSTGTANNTSVNWSAYGLGTSSDLGSEVDGFEVVNLYCWVIPAQFGLLTDAERNAISDMNRNPDAFLELWRFELVNDSYVVSAMPVADRAETLGGIRATIPIYLTYMTQDQLKEAQRSFMELMKGFQRFASAIYNIYIAGMRNNVWGIKGVDTQMFDIKSLKEGDTVGILESKQPGRDVRSGIMTLDSSSGVENALSSVDGILNLKNQFFPSQAMPGQIAGIDRAVKSQVATVVQGAARSLRMVLRTLDSNLMLPTRLAAFRNIKRHDSDGIESLTDEAVAKLTGSGIESMESERVAEALQNLLFAIIQNQESMETFDVPKMLTYMSRVMNLSVDLGAFVRQQPQQPGTPPAQNAEQTVPA